MGEVRFYLDENVPGAVAKGLRHRGVDVETAREAGLLGAADEYHLHHALEHGRVLFTQDTDFLRLHAAGHRHGGIVYAPQQRPLKAVLQGLLLIHDIIDGDEMRGHLEFL